MLLADGGRVEEQGLGREWSISCSNIAVMFGMGPCQVWEGKPSKWVQSEHLGSLVKGGVKMQGQAD